MTSCFENIPTCVWFEGDKRNAIVSISAGLLFSIGWWLIIDANAHNPDAFNAAFHICGIIGTISLFMVNAVTNEQLHGDPFSGGCLGARGVRLWLFIGFVLAFAPVIASCWILFARFVGSSHIWVGVALFLQNLFIFFSSLVFKFGRLDEEGPWG